MTRIPKKFVEKMDREREVLNMSRRAYLNLLGNGIGPLAVVERKERRKKKDVFVIKFNL